MQSDVGNRAAARAVGEPHSAESNTSCPDRVSLKSLSHLGERKVMRVSSADNLASADFQSCVG